jgi:hypothetical protein
MGVGLEGALAGGLGTGEVEAGMGFAPGDASACASTDNCPV